MKNSEPAEPLRQPRPLRHLRASDLRATAQLATQAVVSIAEGAHQSVWRTLGLPGGELPGTTRGLTGLVYRSVNGVAALVGHGAARALAGLEPMLQRLAGQPQETPERAAVIAALNGVMGDRLQAANNPLATQVRHFLHVSL